MLETSVPLKKDITHKAITDLHLESDSHILDAGCGIGHQAVALANAIPDGKVTAMDINDVFLQYAQQHVVPKDMDRITFQQGDIYNLQFSEHSFDCIFSMDCLGYSEKDPVALYKNIARICKPHAQIALLFWASQTLLPGYPQLEAQLNATPDGIAPFTDNMPPESHFMNTQASLKKAGFTSIQMYTYTQQITAPLSPEMRTAMLDLFDMRWGNSQKHISRDAWNTFIKLTRDQSPDCILNKPDYNAFFTYVMFTGNIN